jgi:hypothetical protein
MVDRYRAVDQADDDLGPAAGQGHKSIEADLTERIRQWTGRVHHALVTRQLLTALETSWLRM